jgi:hypothetical protein
MKMRLWDFHPEAQNELNAAAALYNHVRPGLGDAFVDAVDDKLEVAGQIGVPGTRVASIDDEMVRQLLLRPRFPYRIVFAVDVSVVLAVAHMRRHPHYWRKRLRETRAKKASGKPRAHGRSTSRKRSR